MLAVSKEYEKQFRFILHTVQKILWSVQVEFYSTIGSREGIQTSPALKIQLK